jgi:hypothetical protein
MCECVVTLPAIQMAAKLAMQKRNLWGSVQLHRTCEVHRCPRTVGNTQEELVNSQYGMELWQNRKSVLPLSLCVSPVYFPPHLVSVAQPSLCELLSVRARLATAFRVH